MIEKIKKTRGRKAGKPARRLTIWIDVDIYEKLRFISDAERIPFKQVINACGRLGITNFESKFGEIKLEQKKITADQIFAPTAGAVVKTDDTATTPKKTSKDK